MHQHLHPVRALVDEQVRMVSSRFAKHVDDTSEGRIDAGAHVERLYREPGRIDADHFMSSRSSIAHSRAADAGHCRFKLRPFRRISTRITLSTGIEGNATGTKLSTRSIATLGAVGRIAIGALSRSACRTQVRSRLALSPLARATAAIDTPGCWQAPTASALNIALWRRRRRRPI